MLKSLFDEIKNAVTFNATEKIKRRDVTKVIAYSYDKKTNNKRQTDRPGNWNRSMASL